MVALSKEDMDILKGVVKTTTKPSTTSTTTTTKTTTSSIDNIAKAADEEEDNRFLSKGWFKQAAKSTASWLDNAWHTITDRDDKRGIYDYSQYKEYKKQLDAAEDSGNTVDKELFYRSMAEDGIIDYDKYMENYEENSKDYWNSGKRYLEFDKALEENKNDFSSKLKDSLSNSMGNAKNSYEINTITKAVERLTNQRQMFVENVMKTYKDTRDKSLVDYMNDVLEDYDNTIITFATERANNLTTENRKAGGAYYQTLQEDGMRDLANELVKIQNKAQNKMANAAVKDNFKDSWESLTKGNFLSAAGEFVGGVLNSANRILEKIGTGFEEGKQATLGMYDVLEELNHLNTYADDASGFAKAFGTLGNWIMSGVDALPELGPAAIDLLVGSKVGAISKAAKAVKNADKVIDAAEKAKRINNIVNKGKFKGLLKLGDTKGIQYLDEVTKDILVYDVAFQQFEGRPLSTDDMTLNLFMNLPIDGLTVALSKGAKYFKPELAREVLEGETISDDLLKQLKKGIEKGYSDKKLAEIYYMGKSIEDGKIIKDFQRIEDIKAVNKDLGDRLTKIQQDSLSTWDNLTKFTGDLDDMLTEMESRVSRKTRKNGSINEIMEEGIAKLFNKSNLAKVFGKNITVKSNLAFIGNLIEKNQLSADNYKVLEVAINNATKGNDNLNGLLKYMFEGGDDSKLIELLQNGKYDEDAVGEALKNVVYNLVKQNINYLDGADIVNGWIRVDKDRFKNLFTGETELVKSGNITESLNKIFGNEYNISSIELDRVTEGFKDALITEPVEGMYDITNIFGNITSLKFKNNDSVVKDIFDGLGFKFERTNNGISVKGNKEAMDRYIERAEGLKNIDISKGMTSDDISILKLMFIDDYVSMANNNITFLKGMGIPESEAVKYKQQSFVDKIENPLSKKRRDNINKNKQANNKTVTKVQIKSMPKENTDNINKAISNAANGKITQQELETEIANNLSQANVANAKVLEDGTIDEVDLRNQFIELMDGVMSPNRGEMEDNVKNFEGDIRTIKQEQIDNIQQGKEAVADSMISFLRTFNGDKEQYKQIANVAGKFLGVVSMSPSAIKALSNIDSTDFLHTVFSRILIDDSKATSNYLFKGQEVYNRVIAGLNKSKASKDLIEYNKGFKQLGKRIEEAVGILKGGVDSAKRSDLINTLNKIQSFYDVSDYNKGLKQIRRNSKNKLLGKQFILGNTTEKEIEDIAKELATRQLNGMKFFSKEVYDKLIIGYEAGLNRLKNIDGTIKFTISDGKMGYDFSKDNILLGVMSSNILLGNLDDITNLAKISIGHEYAHSKVFKFKKFKSFDEVDKTNLNNTQILNLKAQFDLEKKELEQLGGGVTDYILGLKEYLKEGLKDVQPSKLNQLYNTMNIFTSKGDYEELLNQLDTDNIIDRLCEIGDRILTERNSAYLNKNSLISELLNNDMFNIIDETIAEAYSMKLMMGEGYKGFDVKEIDKVLNQAEKAAELIDRFRNLFYDNNIKSVDDIRNALNENYNIKDLTKPLTANELVENKILKINIKNEDKVEILKKMANVIKLQNISQGVKSDKEIRDGIIKALKQYSNKIKTDLSNIDSKSINKLEYDKILEVLDTMDDSEVVLFGEMIDVVNPSRAKKIYKKAKESPKHTIRDNMFIDYVDSNSVLSEALDIPRINKSTNEVLEKRKAKNTKVANKLLSNKKSDSVNVADTLKTMKGKLGEAGDRALDILINYAKKKNLSIDASKLLVGDADIKAYEESNKFLDFNMFVINKLYNNVLSVGEGAKISDIKGLSVLSEYDYLNAIKNRLMGGTINEAGMVTNKDTTILEWFVDGINDNIGQYISDDGLLTLDTKTILNKMDISEVGEFNNSLYNFIEAFQKGDTTAMDNIERDMLGRLLEKVNESLHLNGVKDIKGFVPGQDKLKNVKSIKLNKGYTDNGVLSQVEMIDRLKNLIGYKGDYMPEDWQMQLFGEEYIQLLKDINGLEPEQIEVKINDFLRDEGMYILEDLSKLDLTKQQKNQIEKLLDNGLYVPELKGKVDIDYLKDMSDIIYEDENFISKELGGAFNNKLETDFYNKETGETVSVGAKQFSLIDNDGNLSYEVLDNLKGIIERTLDDFKYKYSISANNKFKISNDVTDTVKGLSINQGVFFNQAKPTNKELHKLFYNGETMSEYNKFVGYNDGTFGGLVNNLNNGGLEGLKKGDSVVTTFSDGNQLIYKDGHFESNDIVDTLYSALKSIRTKGGTTVNLKGKHYISEGENIYAGDFWNSFVGRYIADELGILPGITIKDSVGNVDLYKQDTLLQGKAVLSEIYNQLIRWEETYLKPLNEINDEALVDAIKEERNRHYGKILEMESIIRNDLQGTPFEVGNKEYKTELEKFKELEIDLNTPGKVDIERREIEDKDTGKKIKAAYNKETGEEYTRKGTYKVKYVIPEYITTKATNNYDFLTDKGNFISSYDEIGLTEGKPQYIEDEIDKSNADIKFEEIRGIDEGEYNKVTQYYGNNTKVIFEDDLGNQVYGRINKTYSIGADGYKYPAYTVDIMGGTPGAYEVDDIVDTIGLSYNKDKGWNYNRIYKELETDELGAPIYPKYSDYEIIDDAIVLVQKEGNEYKGKWLSGIDDTNKSYAAAMNKAKQGRYSNINDRLLNGSTNGEYVRNFEGGKRTKAIMNKQFEYDKANEIASEEGKELGRLGRTLYSLTNKTLIRDDATIRQIVGERDTFLQLNADKLNDILTKWNDLIPKLDKESKDLLFERLQGAINAARRNNDTHLTLIDLSDVNKEASDLISDFAKTMSFNGKRQTTEILSLLNSERSMQDILSKLQNTNLITCMGKMGWNRNDAYTYAVKSARLAGITDATTLRHIGEDFVGDPLGVGKLQRGLQELRGLNNFLKYSIAAPVSGSVMLINGTLLGEQMYRAKARGLSGFMKNDTFEKIVLNDNVLKIFDRGEDILLRGNTDMDMNMLTVTKGLKNIADAVTKEGTTGRKVAETVMLGGIHSIQDLAYNARVRVLAFAQSLQQHGISELQLEDLLKKIESGEMWKDEKLLRSWNDIMAMTEYYYDDFFTNSSSAFMSRNKFSRMFIFNNLQGYVLKRTDEVGRALTGFKNWLANKPKGAHYTRGDFTEHLEQNQELKSFLNNILISTKLAYYMNRVDTVDGKDGDNIARYAIEANDYLSSIPATFIYQLISAPFVGYGKYKTYQDITGEDGSIGDGISVALMNTFSQVCSQFFREGKPLTALMDMVAAYTKTGDIGFAASVLGNDINKISNGLGRFGLIDGLEKYGLEDFGKESDIIGQILLASDKTSDINKSIQDSYDVTFVDNVLNDTKYSFISALGNLPLIGELIKNGTDSGGFSFNEAKVKKLNKMFDEDKYIREIFEGGYNKELFINNPDIVNRIYNDFISFNYPNKSLKSPGKHSVGYFLDGKDTTLDSMKEDVFVENICNELNMSIEDFHDYIMQGGRDSDNVARLKMMAAAEAAQPGSGKIILSYMAASRMYELEKQVSGYGYPKKADFTDEEWTYMQNEVIAEFAKDMYVADRTNQYKVIREYISMVEPEIFNSLKNDNTLRGYANSIGFLDMLTKQAALDGDVNAKYFKNVFSLTGKYMKNDANRLALMRHVMGTIDETDLDYSAKMIANEGCLAGNIDVYNKVKDDEYFRALYPGVCEDFEERIWGVWDYLNLVGKTGGRGYKRNNYKYNNGYNYPSKYQDGNDEVEDKLIKQLAPYTNPFSNQYIPRTNNTSRLPRNKSSIPFTNFNYYRKIYDTQVKAYSDKLVKPTDEGRKGSSGGKIYDWQYKYGEGFKNRGYVNPAKLKFKKHNQPKYSTKVLANMPGASG